MIHGLLGWRSQLSRSEATSETFGLYFSGRKVLEGIIGDLDAFHGLDEANEILFTGSSRACWADRLEWLTAAFCANPPAPAIDPYFYSCEESRVSYVRVLAQATRHSLCTLILCGVLSECCVAVVGHDW